MRGLREHNGTFPGFPPAGVAGQESTTGTKPAGFCPPISKTLILQGGDPLFPGVTVNPTNPTLKETEFSTQFGSVRLIWAESASGPKVERIVLPGDMRAERDGLPRATSVKSVDDESISSLVTGIRSFLSGEAVVFGTDLLNLDRCRPFQRQVLLAEYGIPRGRVSTYGRIARHLGVPGSARAVGNALARNPFPLVIPCHRALRSDGDPGGFQGGQEMKVRLLAMEGARFRPNGKILMEHIWY